MKINLSDVEKNIVNEALHALVRERRRNAPVDCEKELRVARCEHLNRVINSIRRKLCG